MKLVDMTDRPELDEATCFGYRRLKITCDDELADKILRLCFNRGKWIFEKGDDKTCVDGYRCSACGRGFHTKVPYFSEYKFCPECGTRMEGVIFYDE